MGLADKKKKKKKERTLTLPAIKQVSAQRLLLKLSGVTSFFESRTYPVDVARNGLRSSNFVQIRFTLPIRPFLSSHGSCICRLFSNLL